MATRTWVGAGIVGAGVVIAAAAFAAAAQEPAAPAAQPLPTVRTETVREAPDHRTVVLTGAA
ncbi:MAG: hypothetical protein R3F59_19805 [Myxococcota bacterium]